MTASRQIRNILIALFCLPLGCWTAFAQISVALTCSLSSPANVGTTAVWTATVTPSGGSRLYRFSTSTKSGVWNVVRDYGLSNTLPWTSLQEGIVGIQVQVMDTVTGATALAQTAYRFLPIVKAGQDPAISPTANPLVALYSTPSCATGSFVRVSFRPVGGAEPTTTTSPQPCNGSTSLNFYIAGMLPSTAYVMQQRVVTGGSGVPGPVLNFQTGAVPFQFPAFTILNPPNANTSTAEGMLLTSFVGGKTPSLPAATDLAGNPLWYYLDSNDTLDSNPFLTRTTPTSSVLLMLMQGASRRQILREVDLAGNLIRETNATVLSQQLAAMGQSTINWLSHEAVRLRNGHTLVLGTTERLLYNVQGPGKVDVVGDMILDLDQNFQVTWTWNAFDFLPNGRKAILGETCTPQTCGPLYLAPVANDWTHCNSLYYMPNDGSLILSSRNQDWVLKINYRSGAGDGHIIWTLGRQGDFQIISSDPWPWFSHQHDVEFDGTNYELFDDGNTRIAQMGSGNSRGYVLSVDETNMTATPVLLADTGAYSQWWGSAQLLSNGNYQFLNGCLGPLGATVSGCIAYPGRHTDNSLEVQPDGTKNYSILWNSFAYRSFRLKNLYTYVP